MHGNKKRKDLHHSHVALIGFEERTAEAAWIAEAIRALVPSEAEGAIHDKKDGNTRGLALSDLAILLRASTEVRTYMCALESAGIPCVVRAGPDLFSQPEVLLLVAALALCRKWMHFSVPNSIPKAYRNELIRFWNAPRCPSSGRFAGGGAGRCRHLAWRSAVGSKTGSCWLQKPSPTGLDRGTTLSARQAARPSALRPCANF